jgi:hypothetical protein
MNQPFQPAASQKAPSTESQPLNADADPYFSIAMNVPSGPIGTSGVSLPVSQPGQPSLSAPAGHENLQLGLDVLGEIDNRSWQLEDPGTSDDECPMPIRNAYCNEATGASMPSSHGEPSASSERQNVVAQSESGHFIARENCVIVIDGNEGFDYIDLSDRDIAHVTFGDSSMVVLDAETGESFTIEFQNIRHALFANGQMINLGS